MLRLTFEGVPKLVASQLISYTPHLDRLACVQPYNFGAPNSEYYGSSMFSPFVPSPIITAWLRLVLMCVAVGWLGLWDWMGPLTFVAASTIDGIGRVIPRIG